jgi:hypothetical protein
MRKLFISLAILSVFGLCAKDHHSVTFDPIPKVTFADTTKQDTILVEGLVSECVGCRAFSEYLFVVYTSSKDTIRSIDYLLNDKKPIPKNVKVWMISKLKK